MAFLSNVFHHLHLRKRIHKNLEKYPHKQKDKQILDIIVYIAGILGPFMTLPQIWKIYIEQNAAGVSLLSWISYTIIAGIWVWYGLVHKEKPILISNLIWIFMDFAVVFGILLY